MIEILPIIFLSVFISIGLFIFGYLRGLDDAKKDDAPESAEKGDA